MMTQAPSNKEPREVFVGRVEEQKQFRAALKETLKPPRGETLPYVFLLYGGGGIGKTTLARRFLGIAAEEKPFAGKVKCLCVDWEREQARSAALRVGREYVSAEAVFDTIYTVAQRAGWGNEFEAYRRTLRKRQQAEKKAAETLSAGEQRDEWAALRGAGATAVAQILRAAVPAIGQTGEKVSKVLLEAGIKVAAEQAQGLVASLEEYLRAELGGESYALYVHPHEGLARALAHDLASIAGRQALLVVLDTYEIVDRADPWLRLVIQAAGPRLLWVLVGRSNLRDSRPFGDIYFRGYTEDWPRRLVAYDVAQLALEDVKTYFAECVPRRPLNADDAEIMRRATSGIPLALAQAAEMWARDVPLIEIAGDTDEATPGREIVSRMAGRYLLHVVAEDDRRALYALTLARGDLKLVRAMLRPAGEAAFDLPAVLRRLERDYASVYAGEQRLHDEPQAFFILHLKEPQQRTSDVVRGLLARAEDALVARVERIESEYPRIEDHHNDEDWLKATLDLANVRFWQDETEAWRWLVLRFVESLAYSRDLRRGLLQVAGSWKKTLSARGRRRLKALPAPEDWFLSPGEEGDLLRELDRAAALGWLGGPGEEERQAIVAWRRGRWLARQNRHEEALAAYDQAKRGLPPGGEGLREQVGRAFYDLSRACLWPEGARSSVPSAPGLQAARGATELLPEERGLWYNLGVALDDEGRPEEAIAAYQQAIVLDEKDAYPWNGLGNVHAAQGRPEEAIAAYQQAVALDEKFASPWNGLGYVYRSQGWPEEAIAAYQQAIALDEKYASPWNALGNVYRDQGRPEEAIAAYQQAIALDEKYATPWNGLGNLHTLQGELVLALEAFQQAAALAPENGMNRSSLVGILRRLGRHQEAIEQQRLARPLVAQENEYNRACFEAICGNTEEALRLLEIGLEKGQSSREWAARDPDLESLHGDPRFERLVGGYDGD